MSPVPILFFSLMQSFHSVQNIHLWGFLMPPNNSFCVVSQIYLGSPPAQHLQDTVTPQCCLSWPWENVHLCPRQDILFYTHNSHFLISKTWSRNPNSLNTTQGYASTFSTFLPFLCSILVPSLWYWGLSWGPGKDCTIELHLQHGRVCVCVSAPHKVKYNCVGETVS